MSVLTVILRYRRLISLVLHFAIMASAHYVAFWLRFDGDIPSNYFAVMVTTLPLVVVIRAATFVSFGLFQGLWRYSSLWDLRNICGAAVVSGVLIWIAELVFSWGTPRSIHIMSAILLVMLTGGIRMTRRLYDEFRPSGGAHRVLIYGAGDAGELILRDIRRQQRTTKPVGFIDDDRGKTGRRIHGVPVLGTRVNVPAILERYQPDEVLIAVPSASQQTIRGIVRAFEHSKVRITTLPSLTQLMGRSVDVGQIRDLQLEDLLARAPIRLDDAPLRRMVEGRRVLVTGAGGSIGSEISRQLSQFGPSDLIVLDRYENSLFLLLNTLKAAPLRVHGVIADVTDAARIDDVFREYRPELVFHAAAHKHVPLMEANPCEAIKNNVRGTRVVAEAAKQHEIDRFVMVSTDKAVNPTSVMGASKRVAELVVRRVASSGSTNFTTVRFGNVLGSNGSVVPTFLDQIRRGGPVTVTDPQIRRFFMLIPEAVQLVLHSATLGGRACTYVLEMGEQVKLLDVARDLIRLSGYIPEEEIPIIFTGLRPGEKLYEELVADGETAEPSTIDKIQQIRSQRHDTEVPPQAAVEELERAASRGDADAVMRHLRHLVPTFGPMELPQAGHTEIETEHAINT